MEFSHFFENLKNVIYDSKLKKTKSGSGARKTLNFRVSTYSVPSGFRADLHDEARRAEFTHGMNGMFGMGWDGWTGYQSVLRCSSYFVRI